MRLAFSRLGMPAEASYRLYHYDDVVKPVGAHGRLLIVPNPDLLTDQGSLPHGEVVGLPLDVPPGHFAIVVFATFGSNPHHTTGDTRQGFNLNVAS